MTYTCLKCGKEMEPDELRGRVRCIYCGYRILSKQRGTKVKRVKAR